MLLNHAVKALQNFFRVANSFSLWVMIFAFLQESQDKLLAYSDAL
jgi:hypothetical protein